MIPGILARVKALVDLVNWVLGRGDEIKRAVQVIWDKVNDAITFTQQGLNHVIDYVHERIWGGWGHLVWFLNAVTNFLPDAFKRFGTSVVNAIRRLGVELLDHIRAGLRLLEDWVKDRLFDIWVDIKLLTSWVQDWGNKLVYMLTHFPEFLAAHLAGAIYMVADAVGDALDKFIDEHWDD